MLGGSVKRQNCRDNFLLSNGWRLPRRCAPRNDDSFRFIFFGSLLRVR